ncbi:MAG: hypothetical protein ABW278_06600 [Steroidobacteraceae bacterium]
MKHILALVLVSLTCAACADDPAPAAAAAAPAAPDGCLADGSGTLVAQLRGALTQDIAWNNGDMQCEGGPRPEGNGLRLTFAGPTTGPEGTRQLRFIFGIDLQDAAAGAARALPTNITLIMEGEQQLFATRGDQRCAVEALERMALPGDGGHERIHARGYCTSPALDLAGGTSLLVPTFEFTGIVAAGAQP